MKSPQDCARHRHSIRTRLQHSSARPEVSSPRPEIETSVCRPRELRQSALGAPRTPDTTLRRRPVEFGLLCAWCPRRTSSPSASIAAWLLASWSRRSRRSSSGPSRVSSASGLDPRTPGPCGARDPRRVVQVFPKSHSTHRTSSGTNAERRYSVSRFLGPEQSTTVDGCRADNA